MKERRTKSTAQCWRILLNGGTLRHVTGGLLRMKNGEPTYEDGKPSFILVPTDYTEVKTPERKLDKLT